MIIQCSKPKQPSCSSNLGTSAANWRAPIATNMLPRMRTSAMRQAKYLSIFALALLASPNISSAEVATPPGFERFTGNHPAPGSTFASQHFRQTTIAEFSGKILILNMWATWCAPCVKEMPALDRLVSRLPASQFAVIAISQDKGGIAVAKPFLERLGIRDLQVYFDPAGRLMRDCPSSEILRQEAS